jgi:hypothetical protein
VRGGVWARAGLLLVFLVTVSTMAEAQIRPFAFTVTTMGAADGEDWTAFYDAGYAERTSDPFGFGGLEQRLGIQGRLGAGFTVVGRVGFGVDPGNDGRNTEEAEVLKDVLAPASGLRLAVGVGARREWQGGTVALARVSLGRASPGSLLFGNLRLERPLVEGRDTLDVITTFGWMLRAGQALRLGVEAVGEDLEGLWEKEEAEGGAKLYLGPALHWARPGERLWASLGGGPILYAKRNERSSLAPRPLGADGNGFTVRFSVGYVF